MFSYVSPDSGKQALCRQALGRQRSLIKMSPTGDKGKYSSGNSPVSAFVWLLSGQEHLTAKWHDREHLGIWWVHSCPLHCQPNARSMRWKPSCGQHMSTDANRLPRNNLLLFLNNWNSWTLRALAFSASRWTSVCSTQELVCCSSRAPAPLPL